MRLVLAGRNQSRLRALADHLPDTVDVTFDLRDPDTIARPVDVALDRFGSLDGLVNAAGVVGFGPLDHTENGALDEIVEVNLVGPLRLIQRAVPHLDRGFVVNLTGVVAEQPVAGLTAYSAAKAGLSAATRALARELRRRKVLVIDARPPHTETGLAERAISGTAPKMPTGLQPAFVADRIVRAIENGERELPASAFVRTADA